jgi:hypothetical protein
VYIFLNFKTFGLKTNNGTTPLGYKSQAPPNNKPFIPSDEKKKERN